MASSFHECIQEAMSAIRPHHRERIHSYLFKESTLRDAAKILSGDGFAITHERVRQIKNKFIIKLLELLPDNWDAKLEIFFQNNSSGINLMVLSQVDTFFDGSEKYFQDNPKNFFKDILDGTDIAFDTYNDDYFLHHKEAPSSSDLFRIILDGYLDSLNPTSTFKENIALICSIENRSEIAESIYDQIFLKINSNKKLLVKISVNELFNAGNQFITPAMLLEHMRDNYGTTFKLTDAELRNVEGVLSRVPNLRLINKHRYTSYEYYPLFSVDDEDILLDISQEIIGTDPSRQWHLKNIIKKINQDELYSSQLSHECLNKLDHSALNFLLRHYQDERHALTDLKMYIWTSSEFFDDQREDTNSMAYSIIEQHGSPMSLSLIKKEIMKTRGVRKNFQIHVNEVTPDVLPLMRGLWGIRQRDFNISSEEEKKLFKIILDALQGQDFINNYDLSAMLIKNNLHIGINNFQMGRFLQRRVKNRRMSGDYWVKLKSNDDSFLIISTKAHQNDIPNF